MILHVSSMALPAITSAGGTDVFVAKVALTSPTVTWVRGMGGAGNDAGVGLAIDLYGQVVTTGTFQNMADFDPCPPEKFHPRPLGS